MTAATTDSNEERLPPVLTPQWPFQLKVGCFSALFYFIYFATNECVEAIWASKK